jgi:hypothetical protein
MADEILEQDAPALSDMGLPPDFQGMSDEDFMKSAPPEAVLDDDEDSDEEPQTDVVETPPVDAELAPPKTPGDDGPEEPGTDIKEPALQVEGEKPTSINYEQEYKRILAPFKANGKEVSVKSVDDAISLMQMGANYSKRMAGLKPSMRMLKMLENNGLLSEEKISYLIDLSSNNPKAISKLIADSKLDPMDLDTEQASAYTQSTYTVDDTAMDLDTALEEISGTPSYNRTLEIVGNKWDDASKQAVATAPHLLSVINDQVASGIYDLISAEVEQERMFGRLKGLSDIAAYKATGDAMQARGAFNPKPVRAALKAPAGDNGAALKEKKRAASSTKSSGNSTPAKEYNPLGMSDEEFLKIASPLV